MREAKIKEWRRIKSRMKNEAHLPKLVDSKAQEHSEQAWKTKKHNWTPLPQVWILAKLRAKGSKRFFSHKDQ